MKDYSKAKIYRIVCNITGEEYYGSTVQSLSNRRAKHVNQFKMWKTGQHHYTTSFKIIERNNFDIVLVENYPCNSKEELHARERFYIENTECVNKVIPSRTREEYRHTKKDEKKEYDKKYYEEKKQEKLERQKQYYQENKDKIKEYKKMYQEINKDKIREYHKQYHENKKNLTG